MNLDLAHNYKTFQNIHLQWSSTFMVCISDNYADLLKVLSMEISDNIEQILTIVKRKNEKKNVWKFEERLIKTTKQKIIKWKFRQEVVSLKTFIIKTFRQCRSKACVKSKQLKNAVSKLLTCWLTTKVKCRWMLNKNNSSLSPSNAHFKYLNSFIKKD